MNRDTHDPILVTALELQSATSADGDRFGQTRGVWLRRLVRIIGTGVLACVMGMLIANPAAALFENGLSATMQITVGPFSEPPPAPDECSGMTFAEVIVGSPGDDTFHAATGGALIFGLGGNDTLNGGNAKDCLVGGDGNDTLVGGLGKDLLDGGLGVDACVGTRKDTFIACESIDDGADSPGSDSADRETAQPTPTSSTTPAATATASPAGESAAPTESATAGESASPQETATPVPTPTPPPSPTESPTGTPGG